jgi:hypothetical protein
VGMRRKKRRCGTYSRTASLHVPLMGGLTLL